MSQSEEKEIKAATDSFSEAVVVFNSKDFKKAASLFSEIIKTYSDSDYFTVLEIVGKSKSYLFMAEKQLASTDEILESVEDFTSSILILLNSGKLNEALDRIEQSVAKHGTQANVQYLKALVLIRMEQDDKALEALQQSIQADEKFKTIAFNEPDFERLAENPAFRSLTA